MSAHHTQCCNEILKGGGKVEVPSYREGQAWEQNVLSDLGNNIDVRLDTMCVCVDVCMHACVCVHVCMHVCVCVHVCMHACVCVHARVCVHLEQMVEMYFKAVYAVGAYATIKLA